MPFSEHHNTGIKQAPAAFSNSSQYLNTYLFYHSFKQIIMTKVQNPHIGRASGQYGGAVFSTVFGQNIVRSKPVAVKNDPTNAQLMVRQKLALASELIRPLMNFMKPLFEPEMRKMPVHSYLIGKCVKNAISGTLDALVVDSEAIVPALDVKDYASILSIDVTTPTEPLLEWSAVSLQSRFPDYDVAEIEVYALLYNVTKKKAYPNVLMGFGDNEQAKFEIPADETADDFVYYFTAKHPTSKFKSSSELAEKV
jgi:hypothetical protein